MTLGFFLGLGVGNLDFLIEGLTLYQKMNLDFADAFWAVTVLRKGTPTIYSFDAHLNRVDGIIVLKLS